MPNELSSKQVEESYIISYVAPGCRENFRPSTKGIDKPKKGTRNNDLLYCPDEMGMFWNVGQAYVTYT